MATKKNPVTTKLGIDFTKRNETKGAVRYEEDRPNGSAEFHIGTLYLRKPAAERLGNPERLKVTVEGV